MVQPEKISAKDYDYTLPEEHIAKYPRSQREESNLLLYQKGRISGDRFNQIHHYLPADQLMVFNNAQVVYSRLLFQKHTGASIEVFCLEPSDPSEYETAFQQTHSVSWYCMVGNLKKWKAGPLEKELSLPKGKLHLTAQKIQRKENVVEVHFEWDNPHITFGEILDNAGIVPIPPYLQRESEPVDKERYQTVYSRVRGSVAAPTAGLHFSNDVMKKIRDKGINSTELTLHVGAGTFRPVQTETVDDHEMHTEHFSVALETLKDLQRYNFRVLAVGTTSVRTLESLYWLGIQLMDGHNPERPVVLKQWDHLNLDHNVPVSEAIQSIINYLEKNELNAFRASTQIMITPGYSFKLTRSMITNFHQPRSTLLMLIAAFVGEDWKQIYNYALQHDFRFLSYGDSSLLMP